MSATLFLREVQSEDKGRSLLMAIDAVASGVPAAGTRLTDPHSFADVPGSPFCYQASSRLRGLYVRFPSLCKRGYTVKQGLTTADDFRFLRLRWEVAPGRILTGPAEMSQDDSRKQTSLGRTWVPLGKGGFNAPYRVEYPLLVNWGDDGRAIKDYVSGAYPYLNGKWEWVAKNSEYYFRQGISFARRPHRRGYFWVLPKGMIFSDTGPAIFCDDPWFTCAWLNSNIAFSLLKMSQARGEEGGQTMKYEAGDVGQLPCPDVDSSSRADIESIARALFEEHQLSLTGLETSQVFATFNVQIVGKSLASRNTSGEQVEAAAGEASLALQAKIDDILSGCLGVAEGELGDAGAADVATHPLAGEQASDDDTEQDEASAAGLRSEVFSLLSYSVGCAFGRWDIRYATGEKTPPELPDPFASLPVCSPGMLQREDGLPLSATPPGYPLHINWNGILVDEPNHTDDIVKRVREVLHVLWPATSESIETEMCDALGVKDLRDYVRKPGSGGFWMDHVHMYSKSHRKAPIYWLLQSSRKNYGVWLYYQRLDSDLLFKVLQNYVEPKLKLEQNHEAEASHKLTAGGLSVSETRQVQKDLEKQQDLVAEIRGFRDTLKKVADLRLTPDLDDGVVLNIAPLHDLVPWSEASKYWDELLAGKYPWSSIGKQLEQKGMV